MADAMALFTAPEPEPRPAPPVPAERPRFEVAICKGCGAEMIYGRTWPAGKLLPCDVNGDPWGNVVLTWMPRGVPLVTVLRISAQPWETALRHGGTELRTRSHFQTCPASSEFRRR